MELAVRQAEQDRDGDERGRDGNAAAARDRHDIHTAMVRLIDRIDAERDPTDERSEEERDQCRRDEGADQIRKGRPGEEREPHAAGAPATRRALEARDGEAGGDLGDAGREPDVGGRVAALLDRIDDEVADQAHLGGSHATRRHRRRADPDPGRRVRGLRVERDLVLVDGDADFVEQGLPFTPRDAERQDVDEHEVIVGAAGHEPSAAPCERLGHRRGVLDRPPLITAELLRLGNPERNGLARDHLHQRTALDAREHGLVDGRREGGLDVREVGRVDLGRQLAAAEDQPATGSAERLVGRRRDDVGVRERRRMDARRDETRDVGHVDEQQRPDAVGDRRHALEVDDPRIGRCPTDDQLGPDLASLGLERVVVDPLGVLANAVGVDLVEAAAEVQLHAVSQVAALVELHAEDPIARLQDAEVGGHVGLGARVRLDVDVFRAREQGEGPLLGERLGDVDELAAAVVALARQPFGVLVREPAALGLHDGGRGVVLAGDQLDLVVLPAALTLHRLPELGVEVGDRRIRDPRSVRWVDDFGRLGDAHRLDSSSRRRHVRGYLPTIPTPMTRRQAATASSGTAPTRRIRTGSTVQSTTVEAGPPCAGPPSMMQSTASPSCSRDLRGVASRRQTRQVRRRDGQRPDSGRERPRAGVVGHPQPDRRPAAGQLRRQVRRRAAGRRRRSGRPARTPRPGRPPPAARRSRSEPGPLHRGAA